MKMKRLLAIAITVVFLLSLSGTTVLAQEKPQKDQKKTEQTIDQKKNNKDMVQKDSKTKTTKKHRRHRTSLKKEENKPIINK